MRVLVSVSVGVSLAVGVILGNKVNVTVLVEVFVINEKGEVSVGVKVSVRVKEVGDNVRVNVLEGVTDAPAVPPPSVAVSVLLGVTAKPGTVSVGVGSGRAAEIGPKNSDILLLSMISN